MSPRLEAVFTRTRRESRAALVTYLMAGDPSLEASHQAARACIRGGADVVELGFPFSDPIADGPTIQRAAERALRAGTTLGSTLQLAQALRREFAETPLVLMGYLNPVLAMGYPAFFTRAAQAGVDAVIVPDLPPDEAVEARSLAGRHGVCLVGMLAPTSTAARRQAVLSVAKGFTYFVSVTGVTGVRDPGSSLGDEAAAHLAAIRAESAVPVVVGFGIGSADQAHAAAQHADGVVVGSAIVDRIARGEPLQPFVASLRAAVTR